MKQVENVINGKKVTVVVQEGAVYTQKDPETKIVRIDKHGNPVVNACTNQFVANETMYTVFGRKADKSPIIIPGYKGIFGNEATGYSYVGTDGKPHTEYDESKVVTIEKGTHCWIDKNGGIHKADLIGWIITITTDGETKQYSRSKLTADNKPTQFTEESLLGYFSTKAAQELCKKL